MLVTTTLPYLSLEALCDKILNVENMFVLYVGFSLLECLPRNCSGDVFGCEFPFLKHLPRDVIC